MSQPTVELSPQAVKFLEQYQERRRKGFALRVQMTGGGGGCRSGSCAPPSLRLAIGNPTGQDTRVEAGGFTFLFDPMLSRYLEGVQVDADESNLIVYPAGGPAPSCPA